MSETIVVIRPFRFAHDGVRVQEFSPHPQLLPIEVTKRCAEVALQEGWARRPLPPQGPVPALPEAPKAETPADEMRGGPNSDQDERPLGPSSTETGPRSVESGQAQPSSASPQGRRSRNNR